MATNEHAGHVNTAIQTARINAGELDNTRHATTAGGVVYVGDVIATRHNQRNLRTSSGGTVRNRDRRTITDIDDRTGAITASRVGASDSVTLPGEYVAEWVELAYAATDYGNQGDTFTASINLISDATTARGLYVAMTRGRHHNTALVITNSPDPNEACDTLNRVLATDRADTPATVQRRELATSAPTVPTASAPAAPPVTAAPTPARAPTPSPATVTRRVPIPDWFNKYRSTLRQELDDAVNAAERINTRNHQRAVELQQLTAARQMAEHECRPIDEQLSAARENVAQRASDRRAATEDVERSPVWQRRAAKARLALAVDTHEHAGEHLAQLEQTLKPKLQQRDQLRHRVAELERTINDDTIFDRNTNHAGQARHLRYTLDALATWHQWASGDRVPVGDLRDVYSALRAGLEDDWLNDHPRSQLAATLRVGALQSGADIAPDYRTLAPRLPEPRKIELA